MTILSLAIDATQARRGAQEATQAIDQVGKAAENTGRAVDNVAKQVGTSLDAQAAKAKNFSKTVEAVGEVTQISQRVRLLGEEVRNLGSGMGSVASIGQQLSGVLIDIAQISGKVEGGFGGFIALLRSNPLLIAATVLGGIATAMSLFGDETKDANESLQRQISLQEQLRKASEDLAVQIQRNADLQRIGFNVDQQEQQFLRARRIAEVASSLSNQRGTFQLDELSRLTGASTAEIQQLAEQRGLLRTPYGGAVQMTGVGGEPIPTMLTSEAAREVLLLLAQQIRQSGALIGTQTVALPPGGVQGPVVAPSNLFPTIGEMQPQYAGAIGPQIGPGYMSPEQMAAYQSQFQGPGFNIGLEEQAQQARAAQEELRKLEERLQSLRSLGQEVGTAIGTAFFSIVNGAANARQALAALLQQFVAIAQQRAIQGIANSFGNAFAASAPQAASNATSASAGAATGGTRFV